MWFIIGCLIILFIAAAFLGEPPRNGGDGF